MISVRLNGRFGNNLFQYAACRTVAQRLKCPFSIPPSWPSADAHLFNSEDGKDIISCDVGQQPYSRQPLVFNEGENRFNADINKVTAGTHLIGYWQSEKYFSKNAKNVRQWLTPSSPDTEYITPEYCVIHLRAQDSYLSHNYVLPKKYFQDARKYINAHFGITRFVIVTDNAALARDLFPKDTIVSGSLKSDFELLCHAQYKILSNSSFSWWAAWLRLKESTAVIAPDRWLNYNRNHGVPDESFYPFDVKTKGFIYL